METIKGRNSEISKKYCELIYQRCPQEELQCVFIGQFQSITLRLTKAKWLHKHTSYSHQYSSVLTTKWSNYELVIKCKWRLCGEYALQMCTPVWASKLRQCNALRNTCKTCFMARVKRTCIGRYAINTSFSYFIHSHCSRSMKSTQCQTLDVSDVGVINEN